MTLIKVFKDNFEWFNSEIDKIKAYVSDLSVDLNNFSWEDLNSPAHSFDLISSANMLTSHIKDQTFNCCLADIDLKLKAKIDLDWFSRRMHIFGHYVLEFDNIPGLALNSSLDKRDIALIEICSLIFSILVTKHLYQLKSLTSEMAKEIVQSLADKNFIDRTEGEKYSWTIYINTVHNMFLRFLDRQQELMQ